MNVTTVMIEKLKRYWIAFLVLMMVGLHATIIAVIRHQAATAKLSTSCEVELGAFHVNNVAEGEAVRFRVHAIVPESKRLQSRQKLTNRQWEIKQSFEEHFRQLDPALFKDPTLGEVKEQLQSLVVQAIDETTVDKILITELEPAGKMATLSVDPSLIKPPSRDHLVSKHHDSDEDSDHEEADESDAAKNAHGAKPAHGSPATSPAKPAHHAATPAAKKPSSGGHGASAPKAKPAEHKPAAGNSHKPKSGGH